MKIKAVIFDLDGVIVSTDEYHYLAWKMIADREGIHFDREINENLRGVSRMESLEIILKNSNKVYSSIEKEVLAFEKNQHYKELLEQINPDDILPGVESMIAELKTKDIKVAIGSSSKNARLILDRIGLSNTFDVIADGNDIKNSKPDPEVFLVAAKKIGVLPEECIVVEDAYAGIFAAIAAGMDTIGVGFASKCHMAHYKCESLEDLNLEDILT